MKFSLFFQEEIAFDNGKINYSNYKNIQYDFDLIEEGNW